MSGIRFCLIALSALLSVPSLVMSGRSEGGNGKKPAPAIENSVGMKLVLIPRGKFTMGSPVSEMRRNKDEAQREVAITKSFYLGIHEVTQDQFEKVMSFNPGCFSARATGRKNTGYEDW